MTATSETEVLEAAHAVARAHVEWTAMTLANSDVGERAAAESRYRRAVTALAEIASRLATGPEDDPNYRWVTIFPYEDSLGVERYRVEWDNPTQPVRVHHARDRFLTLAEAVAFAHEMENQ